MPFVVSVEIHPESSKVQIRGKTSLFSSTVELNHALLLTIFCTCQGWGIFLSPILQQNEKLPHLFSGNGSNHLTSNSCVWCLTVLHDKLKLCITTPSPITSPVTHLHRTAANQWCQLIIPGLPKISHAGAKGFQIPAVIITSRAGRQVIIVSWNKEVCLNWEVKEDIGTKHWRKLRQNTSDVTVC